MYKRLQPPAPVASIMFCCKGAGDIMMHHDLVPVNVQAIGFLQRVLIQAVCDWRCA